MNSYLSKLAVVSVLSGTITSGVVCAMNAQEQAQMQSAISAGIVDQHNPHEVSAAQQLLEVGVPITRTNIQYVEHHHAVPHQTSAHQHVTPAAVAARPDTERNATVALLHAHLPVTTENVRAAEALLRQGISVTQKNITNYEHKHR